MNQNLKDYICLKYGVPVFEEMTKREIKLISETYGFALYSVGKESNKLMSSIEKEIHPALLKLSRITNKVIKKFRS